MDVRDILQTYNIFWNIPSRNAGESMPVGGHDIGCNIWVENGDIYLYMAQSGAFDEEGRMCKSGRLRIAIEPNPFVEYFSQELKLYEGFVELRGSIKGFPVIVSVWVDMKLPVIEVDVKSKVPVKIGCVYENWRMENSDFRYHDTVMIQEQGILFYHSNQASHPFMERIEEQGIESFMNAFPDVQKDRKFGGLLEMPGMHFAGKTEGIYGNTPYLGFYMETPETVIKQRIKVYLHISQTNEENEWNQQLTELVEKTRQREQNGRETETAKENIEANIRWEETKKWWAQFWNRSYVYIQTQKGDENVDWQTGRNYQLFRYMLACNAYGEYPTKFNGGLFTVDPCFCGTNWNSVNPDDRDWGGLIFTAQNQRLVYWPLIRSGDFELMAPQFRFYTRILKGARARTEHFFHISDAACFAEQIDANGLSAFYGKNGVDFPMQVRHHYVEALEICFMILKYAEASNEDISEYMELISSVVNFYDKKYHCKDEKGKRIIFPSTALETYHKAPDVGLRGKAGVEASNYNDEETAVGNPADVIAALHDILEELLWQGKGTKEQERQWRAFLEELPPIPTERKFGHRVIAPCEYPSVYVKINSEFPQMNVVFPYHIYGLGRPDLQLAVNTFFYGWDEPDQLNHISWHLNGIYAARIGLADDAHRYLRLKLGDSGRKFPAFWGPGHDYVPDHNWGGSGMINVQEMLLQVFEGKIYLLPAWPEELDVTFKLWADKRTVVEAEYMDGRLEYVVTPACRGKDIILPAFPSHIVRRSFSTEPS